jgi:hypothetical protein
MVEILEKTMGEEDAQEFMRLLIVYMNCKRQQRSADRFFSE